MAPTRLLSLNARIPTYRSTSAQHRYVFVSAPDNSCSAPCAKCTHSIREIYYLDIARTKNMCFCTGSHSAPIARCEHSSREVYDIDIVGAPNICVLYRLPTAPTRLLSLNASISEKRYTI